LENLASEPDGGRISAWHVHDDILARLSTTSHFTKLSRLRTAPLSVACSAATLAPGLGLTSSRTGCGAIAPGLAGGSGGGADKRLNSQAASPAATKKLAKPRSRETMGGVLIVGSFCRPSRIKRHGTSPSLVGHNLRAFLLRVNQFLRISRVSESHIAPDWPNVRLTPPG